MGSLPTLITFQLAVLAARGSLARPRHSRGAGTALEIIPATYASPVARVTEKSPCCYCPPSTTVELTHRSKPPAVGGRPHGRSRLPCVSPSRHTRYTRPPVRPEDTGLPQYEGVADPPRERFEGNAALALAKVRGLPAAVRKQAAHGGPHVGGQSEDEGGGQRPEGEVEEQTRGPTSGNRSDCSPAGIWRSFRTASDTSRASERIKGQSSPKRARRTQHNPSPASSMATTSRAWIFRP